LRWYPAHLLKRRFPERYAMLRNAGLPPRQIFRRLRIKAHYQDLGFINHESEPFTKYELRYFQRAIKKLRLAMPLLQQNACLWGYDIAAETSKRVLILIENAARGEVSAPVGEAHLPHQAKPALLQQQGLYGAASHALDLLAGKDRIFNRQQYAWTLKHHPL
jgi:hypothetical protein